MEKRVVLSANNISIGYSAGKSSNLVMPDIAIQLIAGQLTALIGANGIGKSTLLRTLTGLQKPLSGNIYLNGRDISEFTPNELAQNLSVVVTGSLPPSNLTCYELVALGRQPYTNWLGSLSAEDIDKIKNAIELTGTSHLMDKRHFEISDGQLQKVLIARALAQDTPLIVLDEPTTHLDLQHKAGVLRLLRSLAATTGKCIFYSTHDLDLALQLSDEIVVMAHGSITQGSPQELIERRAFDRLFDDEAIVFDAVKGSFIVKNKL